MATTIEKIEAMYERLERARELVTGNKVNPILGMDANYIVASSTGSGYYLVNGSCSCPDAQHRSELTNGVCKHKLAALVFAEGKEKPPAGASN